MMPFLSPSPASSSTQRDSVEAFDQSTTTHLAASRALAISAFQS